MYYSVDTFSPVGANLVYNAMSIVKVIIGLCVLLIPSFAVHSVKVKAFVFIWDSNNQHGM